MGIRKVLILANGTVSVTQKQSGRDGFFGFFNFRNAATWLMFDPGNFINQLAEQCKEEHRLVLDGPGTQGLFMTKYKPSIVQLFFSQQATKDLVNLDGDFCLF